MHALWQVPQVSRDAEPGCHQRLVGGESCVRAAAPEALESVPTSVAVVTLAAAGVNNLRDQCGLGLFAWWRQFLSAARRSWCNRAGRRKQLREQRRRLRRWPIPAFRPDAEHRSAQYRQCPDPEGTARRTLRTQCDGQRGSAHDDQSRRTAAGQTAAERPQAPRSDPGSTASSSDGSIAKEPTSSGTPLFQIDFGRHRVRSNRARQRWSGRWRPKPTPLDSLIRLLL